MLTLVAEAGWYVLLVFDPGVVSVVVVVAGVDDIFVLFVLFLLSFVRDTLKSTSNFCFVKTNMKQVLFMKQYNGQKIILTQEQNLD